MANNAKTQPSAAQLAAMNQQMVANLLASSTEYYLPGAPVSQPLGQQIQLAMPNTGIMIGCDLRCSLSVNATAAMEANPIGAYGTISRVESTDWYGNVRHNVSASRLNSFNGYMIGRPYNSIASSLADAAGDDLYNMPTADATGTMSFTLHVPLIREGGLDGALLTQTSNGTCFINLSTLSASSMISSTNPLAPYSAGTATFGNFTVTPYWRYLMPFNFSASQLPILALSTAFAIQESDSQSNLVAEQQNLMNFPAARTIYGQILDFVNGSSMSFGTDVSRMQIVVNGATPVQTFSANQKLIQMRNRLGADDIPGRYYWGYGTQPINTQIFGSYQMALTPSTVNSGAKMTMANKMTYAMGVPLPGLAV